LAVWLKRVIIGSPLEGFARRFYIRLNPSRVSQYDRLTLDILRRCLRKDSNCIDVGAHRGSILAEIVHLAPHGNHYAFEPVPQHSQYLTKSFPQVKVFQLALSNTRQPTSFVHDRLHPTRSGFSRIAGPGDQFETILVQTDLMDNIIPLALPIQFIKADVEGAEYLVLQGGAETIRAHLPVIVFEHTHQAFDCYGVTPEAMYNLLTRDYRLRISLPQAWLKRRDSLSLEAFQTEVERSRNIYFVAHP